MKSYILVLSIFLFVAANAADGTTRIINNTNLPVSVGYAIPIYSRADTKIQTIKSQRELQDLLFEAILTNSTQEIMQVVEAGADVNLFRDGKALLIWATILKKYNSVETLKRCGAIIPCPQNMLYRAILNDSAEDVKHAVAAGAYFNSECRHQQPFSGNESPVALAIRLTHSKALKALLECGAKVPNVMWVDAECKKYEKPISYALSIKDIKTALVLLQHDENIEVSKILANGGDVFEYLIHSVDPSGIKDLMLEFMQECINHGYDINSPYHRNEIISNKTTKYKSAWVSAIYGQYYSVEILELLMKNGANPNQLIYDSCPSGTVIWTPLHIAIRENNFSAVKFLLDAGADLTKKAGPLVASRSSITLSPQTPLSYTRALALTNVENDKIIKLLIKNGAQ